MIIGLSGYARSGKDSAAAGLEIFGFQRVAFADKLREFLYRLNPMVHRLTEPDKFYTAVYVPERRLQDVIDEYGWDGYKSSYYGDEIRQLLQRLGTECGRELISDTVWIDLALGTGIVKPTNLVVTDVRFPNEAAAIKRRNGFVVRIQRPGVEAVNAHPSETSLDDWEFDAVVDNDGTLDDLHNQMAGCALAFAL